MSPGAGPRRGRPRVFELPVPEDVRREVQFHIDMKIEELMARGWTRDAAKAEADRRFGNTAEVEAECRDIVQRQRRGVRRAWQLGALMQDVRFGARLLLRQPGFTLMAVLTLALGMGANTAVFSVLDSLVLAPLPYAAADRVVAVWEQNESGSEGRVAEPNYLDWKERSRTLQPMAAYRGPWFTPVLGGATPVRRPISIVTEDFFTVMRATPVLGRLPTPEEVRSGGPVAVVRQDFWLMQLGGVRDLSRLTVNVLETSLPVVAVLPDAFDFPVSTDIWVPRLPDAGGTRTSHNYEVVARLSDRASLEMARAEMRGIGEELARTYAPEIDAVSVGVTPLAESLYGSYRAPLLLLLAAASVVLLVACTNLSSSLLARGVSREREMAVRAAVGADRLRLIRQMLTECALLSILGAAAGVGMAAGVLAALRRLAPAAALELRAIRVDLSVLGFTLLAALLATVLFGLVPALRARGSGIASLLRTGDRAGTGRRSGVWNALIVIEVALALVLLVSCGLLVRSFRQILSVDPGFDASNVVAVDVFIPQAVHRSDTAVAQLQTQMLEELARLPGVSAAGVVNTLPGVYGLNGGIEIEGRPEGGYGEYRVASEGFFQAMRIPLLTGRLFQPGDALGAGDVALIDETFAQRFFPDGDAAGRRIRNLSNDAFYYSADRWVTIVGVVGRVQPLGLLEPAMPTVYVNYRQRALRARDGTLTLRTDAHAQLNSAIRETLRRVAPSVPFEISTARQRIGARMADRRFALYVISGFALIALGLAAIGIYGIVSWAVERRTREMGIRIALGAVPRGVAGRIVGEAMMVVTGGVILGLIAAVAATRLIAGMLVAVPATEPLTFTAVVLLLAGVAFLAAALPARRVTRIDPISALRTE